MQSQFLPGVRGLSRRGSEVNKKMTNCNGPGNQANERGYFRSVVIHRHNSLPEVDVRSRIDSGFLLAIPDVSGARGLRFWSPRI